MKELGKGLGTIGIWASLAVLGGQIGEAVVVMSIFGFFATAVIWLR